MKSVLILGNLILTQVSIKPIEGGYRITGIPVRIKKEVQKSKTEFVYRAGRFGGSRGWVRVRDIKKSTPKYVYSHGRGGYSRRRILNKPVVYNWKYSAGRMGHSRFILR